MALARKSKSSTIVLFPHVSPRSVLSGLIIIDDVFLLGAISIGCYIKFGMETPVLGMLF